MIYQAPGPLYTYRDRRDYMGASNAQMVMREASPTQRRAVQVLRHSEQTGIVAAWHDGDEMIARQDGQYGVRFWRISRRGTIRNSGGGDLYVIRTWDTTPVKPLAIV